MFLLVGMYGIVTGVWCSISLVISSIRNAYSKNAT